MSGKLNGKSFCFTGKASMPRAQLQGMVTSAGGVAADRVTKDLDYLVSARDDTSKAKKAQQYGTEVITEEVFMSMI